MANFIRRAIKGTFWKLLDQRPLSQITVKDIVEDCGIDRNSFYYHFDDLPALVDEIVKEQVQALIQNHPTISSVKEYSDAVIELVMENKRAIYHIYDPLNRDMIERYLMDACQYIVSTYLKTEFAGKSLAPQDLDVLIRLHKCACFGSVIDWLNGGMKDDIAGYFRRVCALQKGWLEDQGRWIGYGSRVGLSDSFPPVPVFWAQGFSMPLVKAPPLGYTHGHTRGTRTKRRNKT